jgi:hypothetical protein
MTQSGRTHHRPYSDASAWPWRGPRVGHSLCARSRASPSPCGAWLCLCPKMRTIPKRKPRSGAFLPALGDLVELGAAACASSLSLCYRRIPTRNKRIRIAANAAVHCSGSCSLIRATGTSSTQCATRNCRQRGLKIFDAIDVAATANSYSYRGS